jgi:hypothetical protein
MAGRTDHKVRSAFVPILGEIARDLVFWRGVRRNNSYCKDGMPMARDIDYAATAVKTALVEKFWKDNLQDLQTIACDRTISIHHDGRIAEGTRDDLLAAVRKATSYVNFWEVLASDGRCVG